jgi:hypothetical protein
MGFKSDSGETLEIKGLQKPKSPVFSINFSFTGHR